MIEYSALCADYADKVGYDIRLEEGDIWGELSERTRRAINWQVCGVYHINPQTLTAVASPFIGVLTAEVELLCIPEMMGEVLARLNETATANNAIPRVMTDTAGTDYTVTANYQPATVGDKSDVGTLTGEAVHIRQSITYQIVEGGRTTCTVRIDGNPLPILQLTRRRVDVAQTAPTTFGESTTVVESTTLGIDLQTPAIDSEAARIIAYEVGRQDGKKLAHLVEVAEADEVRVYLMYISTVTESVQPPLNIGYTVSLTEARHDADLPSTIFRLDAETEFGGRYISVPIDYTGDLWCGDYGTRVSAADGKFTHITSAPGYPILGCADGSTMMSDIKVCDRIYSGAIYPTQDITATEAATLLSASFGDSDGIEIKIVSDGIGFAAVLESSTFGGEITLGHTASVGVIIKAGTPIPFPFGGRVTTCEEGLFRWNRYECSRIYGFGTEV